MYDPLIHGPTAEVAKAAPDQEHVQLSEVRPLKETNPLQDLLTLLTQPSKLFLGLRVESSENWVLAKALGGFLVISWCVSYLSLGGSQSQALNYFSQLDFADNSSPLFYLQQKIFKDIIPYLFLSFAHIGAFFGPLFGLFSLLLKTAFCILVLSFFGVAGSSLSYKNIFTALLYARWMHVFSLIPFVGPLLGGILSFVYSIIAMKRMYAVSTSKAFVATNVGFLLFSVISIFLVLMIALVLLLSNSFAS